MYITIYAFTNTHTHKHIFEERYAGKQSSRVLLACANNTFTCRRKDANAFHDDMHTCSLQNPISRVSRNIFERKKASLSLSWGNCGG